MIKDRFLSSYYLMIWLIPLNITWVLLSIPLITAIPATAGLFFATNQLVHKGSANWRTLFLGFRQYFWVSWRWGIIAMLGYGLLVLNAWFYQHWESNLAIWFQGILVTITLLWTILQLYAMPLLIEQRESNLRLALKNAWTLTICSTVQSGKLLLLALVIGIASTIWMPAAWVFISASLVTYAANRETVRVIRALHSEEEKASIHDH